MFLKSAGSYENAKESERDVLVCDENGFAQSKKLPYGTYIVRQTKGWEGRELMDDFEVYIAQDGQTYRYLINNANFESFIKVVKVDAETGVTIPYAGAGFQIYRPDGSKVEMTFTYPTPTTIDTFYTNSEGYLVTPEKLEYGTGYSLVEVQAPYGYVLDSTPVYFDVTEDNSSEEGGVTVIEVTKPNMAQKGIIKVSKTGEVFSSVAESEGIYQPVYEVQGLPGAVFEITALEDVYTLDGTLRYSAGEVVDTITTGEDGTAQSQPLYLGKFQVKEIQFPHGMVDTGENVTNVELVYAGQEVEVTETFTSFYNQRQKALVTLNKVLEQDETFGIGMNGEISAVTFGLYAQEDITAADGSVIPADGLLEIVSVNENGQAICSTDLPFGSFYLKELSTDSHYLLNGETFPFTFEYDGAGIYDLQENRWLRVYGNFPDERAMEQAKQAPATEEPSASPAQADLQPQKEESLPPPPKRPRRERITFTTLHPEVPRDQRHDFHITDDALGHGTPSEKYAANAAAIRTLKQIEAEERLATPEEQEILSRYVGWGGLANCFEQTSPHYEELKSLLDSEEYAAARASSLTAFYTPPVVIRGIYKALSQMGFTQGNILEPSCGTGNFLGLLPADMAGSKAYGVELDSISGRIAGQLYQNASISVNGFETVQMPDSFFDVAVGNVPFGDFKVLDKRYDKHHWLIHDYFFGKTLDKVRPGGIVAFITSKGTLDKENSAVRKYLAQRADLIGAIRLPDNTFKRNAGTEVTSDIIFLQKRDHITDLEPDWVHLDTDENGIRMNSYFVQHPEMILGDMVMESTRFGPDSACKAREGEDLSEQLANAIQFLQAEIKPYELEELDEEEDRSIPADPTVKNFSYTIADGQVYYRENSLMHPVEVSVTAESRIRGMIELRECTRRLIEYQTEGYPDEDIAAEQQKLNALYDSFTAKYGLLNSRGNKLAFSEDSSYCLLCSLEVLDEQGNLKRKADMFSKRTIRPHVAVTSVDTASEALAVSISEKARVDMDYMAELSGKSPEELEQELAGVIYRDIRCAENPEDILPSLADLSRYPLVTADEYLSGKVRQKLRMAKAFLEVAPDHQKEAARKNVEALEAVQPQDLGAGEIGVRIGANWVPVEVYQQFMVELLTPNYYVRDRIRILRSEATGQWSIREKNADRSNVKANTTYGTKRMSAYHILEQTLNQKDVRVFDYIEDENGKKKPVLNKKETAIAQDRQELIKQKFAEWIWKDINRRELLCRIYNETFNGIRPREYDGRHIRFEGMNPEISLRPHQINAIAHILYGGNTLLAHEVGAGKTYEMVAAAMEMKRLGLCTKSLIVVPNHITEQWAAEWLQLYPSANILVATKKDFETQNRKKFCSRIATGDYDAIIIGHSQFEKIPMSVERQQAILKRQIEEILFGIEQAKAQKAERYTVKQMERTRKSLEARLAKLNDQSRKDDVVTFEQLGVDRLFIDESHYFKNLFLATKMRNVGGIAQTEAQKSSDLFMKTQYLDELTGGRGVIFATGTPISNSMVELYTIQRYLQYRLLQEMGLIHFDDWASNFGETVTAIELSPEGTGYRAKTRFAKFYNLPELMAAFKEVANIQTADMLKLPVPKANFHTEVIQPSELQKEMIKGLAERAEKIRAGGVDPHVDNMLRITNDGRKLALDISPWPSFCSAVRLYIGGTCRLHFKGRS